MTFKQFLTYFPEVELPTTLSGETLHVFSRENKALPAEAISTFLVGYDGEGADEFTEFIACLQIPPQDDFYGIVYNRSGLERSDYILATIRKDGQLITRKSIASTSFEGNIVKRSVAQIDEDLIIHIMAGATMDGEEYDPQSSQAFNMEIMQTGDVLFSLDT